MEYFHSVKLVTEKCIGCTDCIKRCPTEAIRVRNGKAIIMNNKCIDCGMCIKVCEQHAKKATTDPLSMIQNYAYKVAIPAPTLYGQFKNIYDVNAILTGIKKLGFDEVIEVAKGAEMVTAYTKHLIDEGNLKRPIISSACPVIIRLISMRFPSLIENILPILSPMEITAQYAKAYLMDKGIPEKDIGIFFISPCSAKATNVRKPLGIEKSSVDGTISMQDIYMRLRYILKNTTESEILIQSTAKGMDWALRGGEGKGLEIDNVINVDGIENVIKVLEEIENGQLEDVDFIEALACTVGCVGGPLTIENSFVAKNNLKKAELFSKVLSEKYKRVIHVDRNKINFDFTKKLSPTSVLSLDEDMGVAIKKMEEVKNIYEKLPHIDCGSCGAPTCKAMAEDIVKNEAQIEDCIFMLRQQVHSLAESMVNLSKKLPPSITNKEAAE